MRLEAKVLGCALAAVIAAAPSVMAQAPTKIGIINIQGAILATKDGERARNEIRAKFETRAKEMEGRGQEIQKLREQFSKGANTMSAEQRDKLSKEIDDKTKKYQWDSEDLQGELQQEEQKLVNGIGQKMIGVIDEFAKAGAYTVVLDISGQASPVIWAANGIDVTPNIVELYDKKFGTGGGVAPSAAAPGTPAAKPTTPIIVPAKKPAGVK